MQFPVHMLYQEQTMRLMQSTDHLLPVRCVSYGNKYPAPGIAGSEQ
jgi:hypothetical protein